MSAYGEISSGWVHPRIIMPIDLTVTIPAFPYPGLISALSPDPVTSKLTLEQQMKELNESFNKLTEAIKKFSTRLEDVNKGPQCLR